MILLIDNYDSFTYNLYQYLTELGEEVMVKRNDRTSLDEIWELEPDAIILSPGPGRPEDAGLCISIIQNLHASLPILGVCLGHQAIAAAFGAEIERAKVIKHGKTSMIRHTGGGLFHYLPQPLEVMRYHSLVVKRETLPPQFETLAVAMDDGEIMAIKHSGYPLYGLQFHPESIGTLSGKDILKHFIDEMRKGNHRETRTEQII